MSVSLLRGVASLLLWRLLPVWRGLSLRLVSVLRRLLAISLWWLSIALLRWRAIAAGLSVALLLLRRIAPLVVLWLVIAAAVLATNWGWWRSSSTRSLFVFGVVGRVDRTQHDLGNLQFMISIANPK